MRPKYSMILVMVLIAALAVAGCSGSNDSSKGTGSTTGGHSSASLPVKPGDMTNMKYLYDNVHYLMESGSTVSTNPDLNGQETTLIWKYGDGNYKGQPAKLLSLITNSSAGRTGTADSFGFDMSYDIYINRTEDVLTMLGGYAYVKFANDPDIMQGDLNFSKLVEESKIRGSTDPVTGEYVVTEGPATFSPTIDLSSPIKPITTTDDMTESLETGYNFGTLMGAGASMYMGFGNTTLTQAGRETLKIGNRNVDCYKYTWRVSIENGQGTSVEWADYTAWYAPEFPAMPVRLVANLNNGETVQTTQIDEWY